MSQSRSEPYELVRIIVMLAALISLAAICVYLVISAFRLGSSFGIRSTAGIMLPLVLGGFLAVFKREMFEKASALPPALAFIVAAFFGVIVMLLLKNIDSLRVAPIAELIVAAGLTILLYAPGSMPGIVQETTRSDVWMAYYFGIVSGMLGYVVFVGFPFVVPS